MQERLTQSDRFARLVTPLGEDVLVLLRLEGHEGLSENFEWRIACVLNSGEDAVDPRDIIGKACHVEMETPSGRSRFFHGLCTEIRFCGWRGDFMYYQLVLRPWSWLLTRETRCRIFHDQSVKDIISGIFNDRGFSDVEMKLQRSYDPIPYCVQYQETTFDFISRLMQRYGLFFFFEFSKDKHKMTVVDDQNSLPDIAGYDGLKYRPYSETGVRGEGLFDWQSESRLRTAIVDVDDYNPEKPNTALEKTGKAKDNPSHGYNQQKKYVWAAGHADPGLGQTLADVLVDSERADAARKFAFGSAPLICAGGVFTLADHPVGDENVKHFAVSAQHRLFLPHGHWTPQPGPGRFATIEAREAAAEPTDDHYEGEYELAEVAKAFKAPLTTRWPRIHGAQTAQVIKDKNAPADEEIDVDDQGRILVRFHWNDAAEDDQCSCRVRVAQIWAGSAWGGVWIPRVGMEAVVEFLDGDPDRPLVTGTVYNGNNKMPYAMPGEKTRSTIKSEISKGGGGFNEVRFEDKKGEEEIFVHAHRHLTTELIEGDETRTIKKGNRTTSIEKGDESLEIRQGQRKTTVKLDDQKTVETGNDVLEINTGNQTTKISAGKGEVSAMQSYEIKVGGSSIRIDQMGVTIKGAMIKIEGDAQLQLKSVMTQVNGDGFLTLKGGLVTIN